MAGHLNKVSLIGNIGKDPEVRATQSGGKIVNLSIATNESWNDKASGERKTKTEWHRVVIFNEKLGEIAAKYLQKGALVYIEGSLQTRKWTDKEGAEKMTTEIIMGAYGGVLTMLGKKDKDAEGDEGGYQSRERQPARTSSPGRDGNASPSWEPAKEDLDNDIPF